MRSRNNRSALNIPRPHERKDDKQEGKIQKSYHAGGPCEAQLWQQLLNHHGVNHAACRISSGHDTNCHGSSRGKVCSDESHAWSEEETTAKSSHDAYVMSEQLRS